MKTGAIVACAVAGVLVSAYAMGPTSVEGNAQTAPTSTSEPAAPPSAASSSGVSATAAWKAGSPDELTADGRASLARLGRWLNDAAGLAVPEAFDAEEADVVVGEISALGRSYPGEDPHVEGALSGMAAALEAGYDAVSGDDAELANTSFGDAADGLDGLYERVVAEVTAVEESTGFRLSETRLPISDAASSTVVTVLRWIDGDTVLTSAGRVRVIGVDTPELSAECAEALDAVAAVESWAPAGTEVILVNPVSVDDTDGYDRMLRYVVLGDGTDVAYSLLLNNLAQARYDSTDGYDWHPRQRAYRATGAAVADKDACGWEDAETSGFALVAAVAAGAAVDGDGGDRGTLLAAFEGVLREADARIESIAADGTRQIAERKAEAERVAAEKAAAEKAEAEKAAREAAAAAARQAELDAARKSSSSSSNAASGSNSGSSSGSSDDLSNYTGCRAYAPGGKTWKPIPCP